MIKIKYILIIKKLLLSNKKASLAVILSLLGMNFSEILLVSFIAPIYDIITQSEFNQISQYIAYSYLKIGLELNLFTACYSLIFFGLLISIFRTFSSWLIYSVKNTFMLDLTSRFMKSSLNADYLSLSRENSGNLMNILTFEMERAGGSLLTIFNFIRDLLLILSLVIFLIAVSPKLTLIFCVIFLPLSMFLRFTHNIIEKNSHKITIYNREFVKHLKEVFDNIKDIKSMNVINGAYDWVINDGKNRLETYKKSSVYASLGENIQHFIMILGLSIIVIIAKQYLGIVSADIIILIGGLVRIAPKISSVQRSLAEFLNLYPGYELITNLSSNLEISNLNLDKERKSISKEKLNSLKRITLNNIYFKYKENDSYIIKNFNCTINKGEITAIIGESGSGKSTLLSMLLGLTKPSKGEIIVSKNIKYSDYIFNNIGYLGQESGLFDLPVMDNINFFKSANIKDVTKLINEFQLSDAKYLQKDFLVGDKGQNISAGQRQRILLIRALVRSPKFLFLDEATNNLDSQTEKIIFETLNGFKKDMFIVVISHNPKIKDYVDKIIELK